MCEDRALRLKRGPGPRLGRVQQARFRTRILRRLRTPPIIHDSNSSSGCSSDGEQNESIPVPSPVAPPVNLRTFPADILNRHRVTDDPWSKASQYNRTRRNGLIDIALRTVVLMRHNQQLQLRLAALQAETRDFIKSVMSNPENQRPKPAASPDSDYKSSPPSSVESMQVEEKSMSSPEVAAEGDLVKS